MTIYDCRDCGEQMHTRLVHGKGMRPGRTTFAANRAVEMPMPCQNPSCPRYRLPLGLEQAVARPE